MDVIRLLQLYYRTEIIKGFVFQNSRHKLVNKSMNALYKIAIKRSEMHYKFH